MVDEKKGKGAEKSAYLGKREELEIYGHKFQVRGLTLGEGLDFSDVVAKLFVKGINLSKGTGQVDENGNEIASLDTGTLNDIVSNSRSDVDRIEKLLCKVTEKPEGFFQEQPPEFFAGILSSVIEMTNIKVVQENFTKMVAKLGVKEIIGKAAAKVPGATLPDLSVN